MLNDLFTQVVVLSLSAALIALLVMALRLVLKKAPRAVICALWALVAVRLLVPALPQSRVSVVPQPVSEGTVVKEISARPVEETVKIREYEPEYVTILARQPQLPVQKEPVKEVKYVEVSAATLEAPKTFGNTVLPVLAWIWLAGVCEMLLYMAFSYARVRRQVQASLPAGDGTFVCDELSSPFILGVIRPRIYLPSALGEEEKSYVLAHEQAHLKRLDHIWKPLGFVLLSLYWFNPVMWAAYILLCRDIELACDEKVIGREGDGFRKAYSQALIACSAPQRLVTACPLAFGEVGVKTRIRSVLNYKKPAFWILAGAMAVCLVAAGCALTNPKDSQPDASAEAVESTPAQSTEAGKPAESTPAQTEPQPTVPPETQPVPPESTADPVDPDAQIWPKEYNVGLLKADQEGVMRAEQKMAAARTLNMMVTPIDQKGGDDFSFSAENRSFFLGRSEKYLWLFPSDDVSRVKSLYFCEDPRSVERHFTRLDPYDISSAVEYYAILDTHSVYLLEEASLPEYSLQQSDNLPDNRFDFLSVPLPAGMTADDVREMTRVMDPETQNWELILISDSFGNWRLNLRNMTWEATELGYHVSRDGDTVTVRSASAVWTIEIPQKDVRIVGTVSYTSLSLCVVEDDGLSASLYYIAALPGEGDTTELITYRSTVDMSDWSCVPARFARGNGNNITVMAPHTEGVLFCSVLVGQSNLEAERLRLPRDGELDYRYRVLGGEVIELMDGAEITDDFPEFSIDLDGNGTTDRFSVEKGVNAQHELCYEFYYNGRSAGRSAEVYQNAYDPDLDISRFHWPEEADFRRNAGYKLYLASMDGEHVLAFISNGEETWGVSFVRTVDVSGESVRFYAVARIRGVGKSMDDFIPNQTLEQYIADGWLVRPMDGDVLDVSGSGAPNTVRVSYEPGANGPVIESIRVYPTDGTAQEPALPGEVSWYSDDQVTERQRFDQLYYSFNGAGYDLIGQIRIGEYLYEDRLKLVDESGEVISGEDAPEMVFAAKLPYEYDPAYSNELLDNRLLLRSWTLSDRNGQENVLLFSYWRDRIRQAFQGWILEKHQIAAEHRTEGTPEYTIRLAEDLEISSLRKDMLQGAFAREYEGQREYYGWINGEACWLPEAFIDTMEEWYRMPMEEQVEKLSPCFYEQIYVQATPEQQERLKAVHPEILNTGTVSEYQREILIAAGQLAADTPRLTLEQAKKICEEVGQPDENHSARERLAQITERFNAIAGAPDRIGGSGMLSAFYQLNEQTEEVERGIIVYVDLWAVEYYSYSKTVKCVALEILWRPDPQE
jgi:beta-lactamase regulating signal transducer with metallopeptidase domain